MYTRRSGVGLGVLNNLLYAVKCLLLYVLIPAQYNDLKII